MAPAQVAERDALLARERAAVDAALGRVAADLMDGGPAALVEPLGFALRGGGKRLRPILCVAAFRAVAGEGASPTPAGAYTIACSLELIHCYSLLHDDLPCMDDDDLRRGRPTTHRVYGERCTVLAGAALIPLACVTADSGAAELGLGPAERMRLVRELCSAAGAGGMVGGQFLDLLAEGHPVALAELEAIHGRKTGALLAASLRMGGLSARAEPELLGALTEFGEAIGLAFQIVDDVLDETGSAETLGKTSGRDRSLEKATFPALLGVDGARQRAGTEVERGLAALGRAGVATAELEALAHYAVERDR